MTARVASIHKGFPYYLLIIYLIIEFIRPQGFIPGMGSLRPGVLLFALMGLYVMTHIQSFTLRDPQTQIFALFLVLMTFHVPLAENNFHAFQVWKGMLYLFFVYIIIVNYIKKIELFDKFYERFLLLLAIAGVVGIVNKGRIPYSAFMGDENDFALLMNMAFALSFFMSLNKRGSGKVFYFILCGVFLTGVILSHSRGGFVGFVPVALFCLFKVKSKAFALLSLGLMALMFLSFAPDDYWDEISTIKEENIQSGTGATRWYYWKCGWRMFVDNPVLGVGQGNFPWRIHEYEDTEGYRGRYHGSRPAHSIYFTLLPELGLIGTILFLLLIKKNFDTIRRIRKYAHQELKYSNAEQASYYDNISLGLLGAFVGYFFSGSFLSVLYYPHFWVFLALPLALEKSMHEMITILESKENG
jgi:hypothetical protein